MTRITFLGAPSSTPIERKAAGTKFGGSNVIFMMNRWIYEDSLAPRRVTTERWQAHDVIGTALSLYRALALSKDIAHNAVSANYALAKLADGFLA